MADGHIPHRTAKARRAAMVASAEQLKIADRAAQAQIRRRESWQDQCWEAFDLLGEVKFAVRLTGNIMSKLDLYVGIRTDNPDEDPIPVRQVLDGEADNVEVNESDGLAAMEALRRLADPSGGHGDLVREFTVNINVAGECYLLGRETAEGERWEIRSVNEIDVQSSRVVVKDDPGEKGRPVTESEPLIRMWEKHPRYSKLADSPLRGVLSSVDEALLSEMATRAALRSRLNNGVWLWPENALPGPDDPTVDESEGAEDPVLQAIVRHIQAPISDESSASALVPYLLRVPDQYVEMMSNSHLTFDRPFDEKIDERFERALRRTAQGLDLPTEFVTGMGEQNHWSAWFADESMWKHFLEPRAVLFVTCINRGYFAGALAEAGVTDRRLVVWFDPHRIVRRPSLEQNADDAHDRFAISDDSYRRAKGFGDDDALSDEELERRLLIRASTVIAQTTGQPPQVGGEPRPAGPENVEPGPPEPDPDTGGAPESDGRQAQTRVRALTAQANGDDGLGARLASLDRQAVVRIEEAADAAMRRAFERVGANLRRRADSDRSAADAIDGVDNEQVAQRLGPALVATLGTDVDGIISDELERRLRPAFVRSASRTADAAVQAAGLEGDAEQQVRRRLDEARDDAWAWLLAALVASARSRLFDPSPQPRGEFDPGMVVDQQALRGALARAGGHGGPHDSPTPGDTRAGEGLGVATGPILLAALAAQGRRTAGWRWSYGSAPRRTFPPHLALDGVEVDRFDDPALANPNAFPPGAFYAPSDHVGCLCGLVPIIPGEG